MSELVITEKANLVAIADKIREKAGSSDDMSFPDGFNEMLNNIGFNGWINKIECFSITLNSSTQTLNSGGTGYHHKLGAIPKGVMVVVDPNTLVAGSVVLYLCSEYSNFQSCELTTTSGFSGGITHSNVSAKKKNVQKCGSHISDFQAVASSSNYFKAGVTYNIMLWI